MLQRKKTLCFAVDAVADDSTAAIVRNPCCRSLRFYTKTSYSRGFRFQGCAQPFLLHLLPADSPSLAHLLRGTQPLRQPENSCWLQFGGQIHSRSLLGRSGNGKFKDQRLLFLGDSDSDPFYGGCAFWESSVVGDERGCAAFFLNNNPIPYRETVNPLLTHLQFSFWGFQLWSNNNNNSTELELCNAAMDTATPLHPHLSQKTTPTPLLPSQPLHSHFTTAGFVVPWWGLSLSLSLSSSLPVYLQLISSMLTQSQPLHAHPTAPRLPRVWLPIFFCIFFFAPENTLLLFLTPPPPL